MNVDIIARNVGLKDSSLVGKAKELERLASLRVTGGLGQVCAWGHGAMHFRKPWSASLHASNMSHAAHHAAQGEVCKAAICLELACTA